MSYEVACQAACDEVEELRGASCGDDLHDEGDTLTTAVL